MVRPAALIVALALTLLGAASVFGAGDADSQEKLYLDVQATGGDAPSVTTFTTLRRNRHYTLVVSGTLSIWPQGAWRQHTTCGTPESFPQTPSPGRRNGPVGLDAETVFAMSRPRSPATCADEALPRHAAEVYGARGLYFDSGSGPQRPVPYDGIHDAPTADHAYTYDLVGEGKPLTLSYVAKQGEDDYGVLDITLTSDAPDPVPVNPTATIAPSPGPGGGPGGPGTTTPPLPAPTVAPSTRGCTQRVLRVRIHNRRHKRLVRGTALFAGRHRTLRRVHSGLRGRLNVRRLGRRRLTVKVVARTKAGRTVVVRRHFRICGR